MPEYFLAEIEVLDPEIYREYTKKASRIVRDYGGEYILRSESITPVAGGWSPQRLVLIRFDSGEDLRRCFGSAEYLAITYLREKSTRSRAVVIDAGADTPSNDPPF